MPIGKDCGSNLLEVLRVEFNRLQADFVALKDKYNAVVTLVNELKADLSAHTHGGVAAGTDSTAAGPTISASDASEASVSAQQVDKY